MYCSFHDLNASNDDPPKRKRQDNYETKHKAKQLKLTDLFTTPTISENSDDVVTETTRDVNLPQTKNVNAKKTYEMIVNNDNDVPMLCVTRIKRTRKPKKHMKNKRRKTTVENRIRVGSHDNSRPVFV